MYFWNINALVQKLKTQTLSSYEQAQYYIVVMLCVSSGTIMQLLPKQQSSINVLQVVATWLVGCAIFSGAVIYCYRINKSGDDKDFLQRMVTLMFTGGIRYGVFSLLVVIPVSMILGILTSYITPANLPEYQTSFTVGGAILGTIWAIGLYWYVGKQFRRVAH